MTEEKTEQAVEQAAAPETKKEEAPAVSLERTLELSVPSAQVRELAQKHPRMPVCPASARAMFR